MSTGLLTKSDRPSTLADLIEWADKLGGIPPSRIRLDPVPGTATEQDAVNAESNGLGLCELVDGVLVEKAMGYFESLVASCLARLLGNFVVARRLGAVTGESGMFRVVRKKIRLPDVAFTSWARLPADYKTRAAPPIAPDLAVEILSPGNTPREIEIKRKEYFAGGTRLIWIIDPLARTAEVWTPDRQEPTRLTAADALDGGDALPGFRLTLADLFADAERPEIPETIRQRKR
jgi:Uma2 family endonuclease